MRSSKWILFAEERVLRRLHSAKEKADYKHTPRTVKSRWWAVWPSVSTFSNRCPSNAAVGRWEDGQVASAGVGNWKTRLAVVAAPKGS